MTVEAHVDKEQPPIRWGILGAGRIARTFTEDLLLLADQVPVAVGSRSSGRAQRFAADYGMEKSYGSYAALAADDSLDVVYVATPHSEHYDAARVCLEAGRAVLVEKPFTVTAAETAQLIALATSKKLFAMEAMWTRFNPIVREVTELVHDGGIGRVTAVQIDLAGAPDYDPAGRLWNPALAGGALLDMGVYPLSFGSMLLGPPDAIRAVATPALTGVDANTAVIARYPGGAVGLYHCGLWARSPQVATIIGTRGTIIVGSPTGAAFYKPDSYTLIPADGGEPRTREIALHGTGFTYEAAEVARCLRAGLTESPLMSLAGTLEVMRVLDAARAASGSIDAQHGVK
ncbi:MAG TPA: Gfo/Idh/MocA family oxidoreductase [Streptosporangiaceae bacterium]|nr:Gfo/Idh/MocA family oxidoreductase [Streptosporangiaceae bacterium]